jgi:hypothetical protein
MQMQPAVPRPFFIRNLKLVGAALLSALICFMALNKAAAQTNVQMVSNIQTPSVDGDWLVTPSTQPVTLQVTDASATPAHLALANGIIAREFYFGGNLATVSERDLGDGSEFVRAIKPEALITINGTQYPVGGLNGQTVNNFLSSSWYSSLTPPTGAFTFSGYATMAPQAFRSWTNRFGAPAVSWPPAGLRVDMFYNPPAALPGIQVTVHYEMYQGVPIIAKWITVSNNAASSNLINSLTVEQLGVSPPLRTRLFTESEFNCFRLITSFWELDSAYTTETGPVFTERMEGEPINYWSLSILTNSWSAQGADPEWQGEYVSRSQLSVRYPSGPWKRLAPGQSYDSFIVWEIPQDSGDAERQGLARRKLYRTVMPWTQESPIDVHITASDDASIRAAVDQAAAAGFEKVVVSYGSGFNMLNTNAAYIADMKANFDYAHSNGISIGGYILFADSQNYGSQYESVPSEGLCLGSSYSDVLFQTIYNFADQTGMNVIETDGPYAGYPCTSTTHEYHEGANDALRVNWERQMLFYQGCVARNMFIEAPDWYYYGGNSLVSMGYRESNAGLPVALQTVIDRQTIFDATWWRTPGMSWNDGMFSPPLSTPNLYQTVFANYFGAGTPGQFWMPLYDSSTFSLVQGWVNWFKKYRPILMSDIIHVKRADGRALDCWLHVNPSLPTCGLAMVFNPTANAVMTYFTLPLYYTGVTNTAMIREQEGVERAYILDSQGRVQVPVYLPAGGQSWFVVGQNNGSTPALGDPVLSAPPTVNFGTLANNANQTLSIQVANLGKNNSLHLTVVITNSSLFQVSSQVVTIAPQSTGLIAVYAVPAGVVGPTNATLVINGDDPTQPIANVALSATFQNPVPPVTELFLYRMGEDDPGAVGGNPGNTQTLPSIGTLPMNELGQAAYSTNTAGPASLLSIQFSGSGGYTNLPGPITTNNFFGIECWARVDAVPSHFATVLNTDGGGNNAGLTIGLNTSGEWQAVRQGVSVFGSTTSALGTWTELAVVVNNGTSTFYVNGVAMGTGSAPSANARLDVGCQYQTSSHTLANLFTGYIDDVRGFTFTTNQFSATTSLHYPYPQIAAPLLQVGVTNNSVALNWAASGFVLQQNTNIANPAGWISVPGGTSPLTLPLTNSGRLFFRLIK